MTIVEIGHIFQDISSYGPALAPTHASTNLLYGYLGDHIAGGYLWKHSTVAEWMILAQQFDTDPFAGIREWFGNLVATGQLWALIIGFILGYLFRGFTSYG